MKWKRQKTEHESGDYSFNGKCLVTNGVNSELPEEEVIAIVQNVHNMVSTLDGIDYMQTYLHVETKKKIWVIDQVTRTSLQNGNHLLEHNYFAILFPHEY